MRSQKNRLLGNLTGFGLAALAVACALLICLASPVQCRSLEESIERVFETGPTPEVHIRSFNGEIEVRGGSGTGVRAAMTKHVYRLTGLGAERALDAIEVQMVQDGERIVIEALGPQMRMFLKCTGAYLRIEVPAGARVFAETTNGPIRTEGLTSFQSVKTSDAKIEVRSARGEIHAESSNGAIHAEIEDATLRATTSNAALDVRARNSDIEATTSNGAIEVEIDGGTVRARSSSGRIEIEGRATRADAETTNGAIEMEFGDAPVHAHARTTNGAIEFEGRPAAISVLRTTNGRIEAEVPKNAEFWIEASTTNGSIRHDLNLSEVKVQEKNRLAGRVGVDTAARLLLETSNSAIDVDVN